jgi:hypothetical protein
MQKVKLNMPHTHNGTRYAAGAEIDVDQTDADWLVQQHVTDPPSVISEKSSNTTSNNNEVQK